MKKKDFIARFAETEEDKIILAHILDKEALTAERDIPTAVHFLDMRLQSIILSAEKYFSVMPVLWGGFPDAERKMLFFLPSYMTEVPADAISLLIATHKAPKAPAHRDYLGSILGLGLTRANVGDILVSEKGAQILVAKEIADFILTNLTSAGHVHLSVTEKPLSALEIPHAEATEKTVTLSSLRIDGAVSAAFGVSRSIAAAAVESGAIYVNDRVVSKNSYLVDGGDKIKWHRHGRAYVERIGGQSRKGRIFVTFRLNT